MSFDQENFEKEKKDAEEGLKFAEESFGPDHPMVAARLELLALLLRKQGKQLLDAANFEARAKAIRANYEKEEFLSAPGKLKHSPAAKATKTTSLQTTP